ncbi:MAG: hypothetical protein GQ527_07110, partial [Bacteroidales bacterium]|nr:hypothetical protein [Bacteroidales bacterium]
LQQEKQSFTIQMQKGKILTQRHFNTKIFGEKHPYGRMANIDAYDHIHRDLLLDFHKENYQIANWHILVSGKTTANTIAILNKYFGLMERGDRNSIQPKLTLPSLSESANYFIEQKQAVQTSIKMGKLSIGRQHKDYPILSLTQTILGGYFGSRLMKNIREDKGYTYGINSHISHQAQASVFSIGSDVGSEVANATLDEIKKELSLLSNELVPANELKLVKNYMAGGLLRSLNGPFALGEMMRMIYDHQLPMNYFSQYISSVQAATSEDILKSVRTHLQEDQMISVMAGKQEAN